MSQLRRRADLWATSLFAALGVLPMASCSGEVAENPFPCNEPQSLMGAQSGYVLCDGGAVVRQGAAQCTSSLPRAGEQHPAPSPGECQYDADCTLADNGYCSAEGFCGYGCTTDADCTDGMICLCGDPVGQCSYASCSSDDDCASGLHCASYPTGCGATAFACQSPSDECLVDADCGGMACIFDNVREVRACSGGGCGAIGRPFLVDDVARVAAAARRSDWLASDSAPELERLTPELRQRLAEDWTRAAQLEHASVAAFARFLLELMAFGAPSELVAETVSAIEDERQHARICFTLASEYAGELIGPGALDVQGALQTPTLARSLATTVREGCIGETVAALEASELAAHVVDPLLQQLLERIAADERRHSELAWKFAQWAMTQDAGLIDVLERELALVREELAGYAALTSGPRAHELARAGVMPEALRAAVRDAGLRQIVEPGLAGMIEHARRGRSAA